MKKKQEKIFDNPWCTKMDIYLSAALKADELEAELKSLGRWMVNPLPDECFDNMGAFGSNTMSFENWLQYILLPRIRIIAVEKGHFPTGSHMAPYAIRYFDGDTAADGLREILYAIDLLINNKPVSSLNPTQQPPINTPSPTVSIGDTTVPAVLYSVADSLPQFVLHDLENQLQTFDTFLDFLSPSVRPTISNILKNAAQQTSNADCRKRIEQAALDIADGKRAAAPYNHEEAMKKNQEEHRKNFSPQ